MSDEDPDRSEPNDEYPLGPPGKSLADHEYSILPLYREPPVEEEPAEDQARPIQFTLAHMLWVMTFVAVGLSVLRCFPVDFSRTIAAVAGVVLLLALAILETVKPADRRVYWAWWIGVGVYAISSITAALRG